MKGIVNTFNHDTGHGTVQTEDGTQYFFTYTECYSPPDEMYASGDEVDFELRYVNDMPIAYGLAVCTYDYEGGYN